jgi:hypothetical protein
MTIHAPIKPTDGTPFTPEERRTQLFERIAKDFDALVDYADIGMRHALRGREMQTIADAKDVAAHLRDIFATLEDLAKIRPSDESFEYGH